jgi:hypothetical protein
VLLTEGEWEIQTETSVYIVNADTMTLWRRPGGAGSLDRTTTEHRPLRGDGEFVRLLYRPQVVVGQPAVLALAVRSDGVATVRQTTLVCHVSRLA